MRRYLAQYVFSLAAVAAGLLIRWLLNPLLRDDVPVLVVFAVVMPLALLVRPGPFLAGAILGLVGCWLLFLTPKHSLRIDTPEDLLRLVLFGVSIGAAAITAWLSARARDALEASEHSLREADQRKTEFLATLSHELRGPLAPIRNAVQLLQFKPSSDPDAQWSRDVIDRQVRTMARLLDDLMDISRITRGKLELRREIVELHSIIKRAAEMSGPILESAGVHLHLVMDGEPIWANADPVRLTQVFSNLLTNAGKYTDAGGEVWLSLKKNQEGAVLSVKDTGIGIAPEMLPRIFEMFAQSEMALNRDQGGLGIGLWLVRGLIQLHGGTIEVRSDGVGRGSEFTVTLPTTAPPPQPLPGNGEAERVKGARCRVLVAEDNRDTAETLARLLRMEGHEAIVASDGRLAMEQARKHHPNVALLDIGLPQISGYDVARQVRKQPWGKEVLLVAVTGWGQEDDKRKAAEAGFDRHLVKPVDPEFLLQLINDLRPNAAGDDRGARPSPEETG